MWLRHTKEPCDPPLADLNALFLWLFLSYLSGLGYLSYLFLFKVPKRAFWAPLPEKGSLVRLLPRNLFQPLTIKINCCSVPVKTFLTCSANGSTRFKLNLFNLFLRVATLNIKITISQQKLFVNTFGSDSIFHEENEESCSLFNRPMYDD
ncbi:hypothetical protein A3E45_04210 [Candidatus Daviesbacteria bacterium RIFCSPHIGHO2_12_FULL_43_11]|uniref:Uncharacterized protein n=1 Tax=Candidatus Daviesbacteria bacterium RIFCSPHIGHO2_12_FULL_43_11 TaxID=1797780 RepID=A0A1F5K5R2_9BACT|nr:MAG: hypothetical protein A2874_02270 [Candidatus Daviesbacteria bacterium RIFCSPHIGHO2_01_FULL_43_17]OGE36267.1 MAG: hypothetical protein A3E45_04210 [Candidatus Daviesbacteria bacterium RIFCSPHIGHO2_12_FULL_43_11]